jgi:hypothetical protein
MGRPRFLSEEQSSALALLSNLSGDERLGFRVVGQTEGSVSDLRDLGAMKLSAIANRGIRRDFWDVFEICASGLTLLDLVQSYQARFGVRQADVYHVIRCLTYFDDAEADPLLPRGLTLTRWEEIKRFFLAEAPRIVERLGG